MIAPAPSVSHANWPRYLYSIGNKKGVTILEVGSRGPYATEYRNNLPLAEYIGFDYYPGLNVDVVGDVHKLSTYFNPGQQFDIVFSSACLEHFAMPWIAAREMVKMLKVGGTLIIETHFAYGSHSRPWHFFHFTDMGLRCLFPKAMGMDCIEAGMCNPIAGRFTEHADQYLRNQPVTDMYCHSNYLGIKRREVPGFTWDDANIDELVNQTKYPAP
jgi:SAM-dependent methyltransferase